MGDTSYYYATSWVCSKCSHEQAGGKHPFYNRRLDPYRCKMCESPRPPPPRVVVAYPPSFLAVGRQSPAVASSTATTARAPSEGDNALFNDEVNNAGILIFT
jgi:hypothetical protein